MKSYNHLFEKLVSEENIKLAIYECKQFLSYIGWLNCTDTYNVYLKHIKPFINIKYIKKRISRYDRKANKLCGTNQNLLLNL